MLRTVCNDRISSYNELLSIVNRPMLYWNTNKALVDQVFKVLYGFSPPVSPDFFTKQFITYDLRDNFMLMQPHFRTIQYGFKSIAYQATTVLNTLPCDLTSITVYKLFKKALALDDFKECKCGNCFMCTFS